MKRITFAVAGCLLAGMALSTQAQTVSRNAVGYTKVTVLATNLYLAAMPFYEVGGDGAYKLGEVLGDQLNAGSSFFVADQVLKYDPSLPGYVIYWKHTSGQWRRFPQTTETTDTLNPGEAFWVINKKDTNQTLYLVGEVPDRFTVPTSTQSVDIVEGIQMLSYAFPTKIAISNTTLSAVAKPGGSFFTADQLITWNDVARSYSIYWLHTSLNWRKFPQSTTTTDELDPGQGAFFLHTEPTTVTWVEEKKYTWP